MSLISKGSVKMKKLYEIKELINKNKVHIGYVRASGMSAIADYFTARMPKRVFLIYPITNLDIEKNKIKTIYDKKKKR